MAVAQGRIDTARHLLSFHPLKSSSAFKAVDEQLRSMPNFAVKQVYYALNKQHSNIIGEKILAHLSLFEFKAKWEYWQKKCIQVLTTEDFSIEETGSLELICKVILRFCDHNLYFIRLLIYFCSKRCFALMRKHLFS